MSDATPATFRVTQYRSRNGANKAQIATLRSLGLRRIGQRVEVSDTPQSRGMLHAVRHLVQIEGPGNE
jgi:large subunit ribosomal protein L30